MLSSVDDFYMTDSKLVVFETTNSILNSTLYQLIKPESLVSWIRVRIANIFSKTG